MMEVRPLRSTNCGAVGVVEILIARSLVYSKLQEFV
jgi:hypothetical protein